MLLSNYSNMSIGGRMESFYSTLPIEWTEHAGLPFLDSLQRE
jgi:hypothetical protein